MGNIIKVHFVVVHPDFTAWEQSCVARFFGLVDETQRHVEEAYLPSTCVGLFQPDSLAGQGL